jgi:membrane protein
MFALVTEHHSRLADGMHLAQRVFAEQSAQRASLVASGAAFWLVISAFPAAIAVVSLYGLFVSAERVANDLGALADDAPGSLGSLVTEQVRSVAGHNNAGLSLGVIVSLLVALWAASAGIYQLDNAIRAAYDLPPQRFVDARARAIVGALAAVVLLGLTAIALPLVVARTAWIATILAVPVALIAIAVTVAGFYRLSVGHRLGGRAVLPGAVLSAAGIVLVSVGFDVYVARSSKYTAVYGGFAGSVIAMLAAYLAVRVVLLGASLNAELARGRARGGGVASEDC